VPLYEFDCCACGARFEEVVPAGWAAPCPACGGERVNRAFSQISARGVPVGLSGAVVRESDARRAQREAVKERFVAERKRKRRQGPPGG
jgi:putative FmdB family regulatory protein